jgi:hypothetical protein
MLFFHEEEDVGLAAEECAEIFLEALPISFGIRTRCRDNRSLGFLWFDSRMISRSIAAVPLVRISPPPIATMALDIASS